jgi:hypothetical protein
VTEHLPKIANSQADKPASRVSAILRRPDLYAARFASNFVYFWELYPSRLKMSEQEYRDNLNAKDSRIVKETIYSANQLINAVSLLSTGPILAFALIGTVAMYWRRGLRRELSLLWLVMLSFAVGYAFFVGKIRYRIPVEPYLIVLSACGFDEAYRLLSARFRSAVNESVSVLSRG